MLQFLHTRYQTVVLEFSLCLFFQNKLDSFAHFTQKPLLISAFITGSSKCLDQAQIRLLNQIGQLHFFYIHLNSHICRRFHIIRSKCLKCPLITGCQSFKYTVSIHLINNRQFLQIIFKISFFFCCKRNFFMFRLLGFFSCRFQTFNENSLRSKIF